MNALMKGALSLSMLGLVACIDSGGNDEEDIYTQHYQLEAYPAGSRPWIMLEGAALDPLYLTFNITQSVYINGEPEDDNTVTYLRELITINNAIYNPEVGTPDESALTITATSSNTSVVAIENGKLVGKAPGKATISLNIDISDQYKSHIENSDNKIEGFQGSHEYGEIVVCPYVDVDLGLVSPFVQTLEQDAHAPLHAVSYIYEKTDNGEQRVIETNIKAYPEIDVERLAEAGLTISDCDIRENSSQVEIGSQSFNPVIHSEVTPYDFYRYDDGDGFLTVSGISLMGFDFPNASISKVNSLSDFEITELGYGGYLVPNALNPIKIEAFSSELNQTVEVTNLYFSESNLANDYSYNLGVPVDEQEEGIFNSIQLLHNHLPELTSDSLQIKNGAPNFKLDKVSGLPGTTFTVISSLLVDGVEYDTSGVFALQNGSAPHLTSFYVDEDKLKVGNQFTVYDSTEGTVGIWNENELISSKYITGDATDEAIRGRWVQADTGQDHYIAAHSTNEYSQVTDNLITYPAGSGKTATLIRTGINNVALSGNVNVVTDDSGSNLVFTRDGYSADSLGGIGNIDLVLENVNTGEEVEVTVAEDGSFNEEVPTGEYDVSGTVVDGDITYNIETRITIEKDATDAGNLNLAEVGLYNFDVALSGCLYDYKCYADQSYTFTIKVTNTGYIAASGIQATIADMSGHENVTAWDVPGLPISGAARGDDIEYTFTATFNQPSEDTVIEVPITLTDANARTWEDVVKINLSAYDPVDVSIKAYNFGASANVRGYLLVEGRTPIRVNGSDSTITVPNIPGASYELILANEEFNQETPYGVANNATLTESDFDGFNDLSRNENADDTAAGAQVVNDGESFISYISAGDVDHYTINLPTP